MSRLSILSHMDLGPLDVSIQGAAGEDVEFALSSGRTQHQVTLKRGQYAIVARRPNGELLRRTVTLGPQDVTVNLADQVPPTPNEFMAMETERGQIRPAGLPKRGPAEQPGAVLAGAAGRILANTITHALPDLGSLSDAGIGAVGAASLSFDFDAAFTRSVQKLAARKRARTLRLRLWRLSGDQWTPHRDRNDWGMARSADFLKVRLNPARQIRAVALVDGRGLGPVVMIPPLATVAEVSFLADGVLARIADRDHVPGGERAPVALVHIDSPPAADLLATLASPRTPRAEELWEQTAPGLAGGPPDAAIGMLLGKFEQPGEALLAAHYLVRFMPDRLPLAWAENLAKALPVAADGPVLAAWTWVNNPPPAASGADINNAVHRWIKAALDRPTVLFARTRALLFDALDLCGPQTAERGRALQLPYRRAGAGAGGFECFWGGGPNSPGRPVRAGEHALAELAFDRGAFLPA
ncbi:MAG TPA: hypothetical protein VEA44_07565 [Caulobacter sp.]|nr:hypothetical protein [Caulobacter sp.]